MLLKKQIMELNKKYEKNFNHNGNVNKCRCGN